MEGTLLGIPSIAVSLIGRHEFAFEAAAEFARPACALGADHRTARGYAAERERTAAAGRGRRPAASSAPGWGVAATATPSSRRSIRGGRKYYWIGGEELDFVEEEGTDFYAVRQGRISVTPIHLDLTNYRSFDALAGVDSTWP
jgi:5'-nucleotidase